MEPVVLRTERLVLSIPTLDDVDAITESCQDAQFPEVLARLPWPYTRNDSVEYVTDMAVPGWESGDSPIWAIRETEGGAHLGSIAWGRERSDIGYWLDARVRGRGYMTEAVRAVCDWAFTEHGVEQILWEAVAGNRASAGVARAAGFRFTGARPVEVEFRDGTHPHGWHGVIERDDRSAPKDGWPL